MYGLLPVYEFNMSIASVNFFKLERSAEVSNIIFLTLVSISFNVFLLFFNVASCIFSSVFQSYFPPLFSYFIILNLTPLSYFFFKSFLYVAFFFLGSLNNIPFFVFLNADAPTFFIFVVFSVTVLSFLHL